MLNEGLVLSTCEVTEEVGHPMRLLLLSSSTWYSVE